MKTYVKTLLAALALTFAFSLNARADKDTPIQVNQLPAAAQTLLKKHFSGKKVALAKMESDMLGKSYEVIFTNGDKVEFDRNGKWTDLSCKKGAVPSALVPAAISRYVKAHYKGARVVELERERKGYGLELSNGVELDFNNKFQLTEFDR